KPRARLSRFSFFWFNRDAFWHLFCSMDKPPPIYLVFTDDWELRGDGSGDIERIQFGPMRRLLEVFEKHGMRCTFMAEMMQQLTFRARQEEHPELKPRAD